MKLLFAIIFVTLYGLSMRLLFGLFDGAMGVMTITFLFFLPFTIGFLTVVLLKRTAIESGLAAFFVPWLTSGVILIVTIALSIEGAICWVMIYPLFSIVAGLGGLLAFYYRKRRSKGNTDENEDWEKPSALNVSFLIFVPLILGFAEGERTTSKEEITLSKSIILPASSIAVWQELIKKDQVGGKGNALSLPNILGFPCHLHTTLDKPEIGEERIAYYDKGLRFEEFVIQSIPKKLLILEIKTDPTKIPKNVMDEHIVIGGKHVDILEDTYQLEQLPDGRTQLSLSSRFMINTPFNWYSKIWAHYLMTDILDEQLDLIKEKVGEGK